MQKELVDTHCHLYLDDFTGDLDEVLKRAENHGIKRIFMPAIDSSHLKRMMELQKTYVGRCYSMLGLHPCSVREDYQTELDLIRKVIEEDQFVAIGEIGLDYYWSRDYDAQQMICFRQQIELARAHRLPIVIHSRNSMDACLEVVKEESKNGISGIFHCFTGTVDNAMQIIDCGMMLGIGGVVTYKNSGLADVVAQVPLDSIVLETDAPYLTPVPFRGKRNESSYLKYIVEKIASVKNISVDEVADTTTRNAYKVFNRS
ncbi:MAG: TatD family hydrolase [Chitinophagaceae bacterium]|nr:TatD family hydrolase [Chitinophagaceae bacterium]